MAKTKFERDTRLSSAWFRAMQDIKFDGLDEDGHYPPIDGSALDLSSNPIGAQITSLASSYATLSTNYNSLNTTVGGLQTSYNSLNSRLTSAENVNTSQQTTINTLNSNYTALTTAVGTNTSALSGLNSRVTTLENSSATGLETRISAAENSITNLQSSVAAINTTNSTQTSDISSLTSRVTALESNPGGVPATSIAKTLSYYSTVAVTSNPSLSQHLAVTGNAISGYMTENGKPFNLIRREFIKNNSRGQDYFFLLLSGVIFNLNENCTDTSKMRLMAKEQFGLATSHPSYNMYGRFISRSVLPYLLLAFSTNWLIARPNVQHKVYLRVEDDATNRDSLGSVYDNTTVDYFDTEPYIYGETTTVSKCSYYCPAIGLRVSTVITSASPYTASVTEYGWLGWDTANVTSSGTTYIGTLEVNGSVFTSSMTAANMTQADDLLYFRPYWDSTGSYSPLSGQHSNKGGTFSYQDEQLQAMFTPL
jgi:uncharacterized coiled-coil protein SlyX